MKKGIVALFIFSLILGFVSCNKDDDNGDDFVEEEIRDRGEQQIIDNDSIVGYLETHYYNSGDFSGNANPSIADLVITELLEGETVPVGNTMLDVAVDVDNPRTVTFANTVYQYYVLNLNPNADGDSPSFADEVRVRYEGFELNGDVFDSAVTPVDFDLVSLVPGWRKVLPEFNTSSSFVIEDDGVVSYTNHGVGVMFLPSGLGYFSNRTGGIPSYSPLVFKFDLLQMTVNDHDNDGVPSYLEDLNGDGEFTIADFEDDTITHDDTDGNSIPDYFDPDDDGDGVLTIDEDIDGDGDPTNDIGANGIPKYLDDTETATKE